MAIRRADFWHAKPGKASDFIARFQDFKAGIQNMTGEEANATLVRVSAGGQGPESYYWFGDWESMADYGAFIDEARVSDDVRKHWTGFFTPDSPAIYNGTSILSKVAKYGNPFPRVVGTCAIVRISQPKPGYDSVARSIQGALIEHQQRFGGHLEVWRAISAGPNTGNIVTAAIFPDMKSLGGWLDQTMTNTEVQDILAPYMSADPPARLLNTNIVTVIAT